VEILRTVLRGDGGALHYRVVARRHLRVRPELARPDSVPVEYELRTYRLSLDGGQAHLLAQRRELCGEACARLD
jgi:hypothetical protein